MTPQRAIGLTLLAALGLAGCNESALFAKNDEAATDYGDTGDLDGASDEAFTLRVDVYPSDAGPTLLPQSWLITGEQDWIGLDVALEAPIAVTGAVTGYAATPYATITVPGAEGPISARVSAERTGTISADATSTDEDGGFLLALTPGDGYVFAVIPAESARLPFLVATDQSFTGDLAFDDVDLALGYGAPVYGRVMDASGDGVPGALVSLIEPDTGVQGPVTTTGSDGYYMLRSLEGAWSLRVAGEAGSYLPTIDTYLVVEDDTGVLLDVEIGDTSPVTVRGKVLDEDGDPVSDVSVRFISSLLSYADGEAVVETNPDKNGIFIVELLPGQWGAEFIPDYDTELSPVAVDFDVDDDGDTLPAEVELPGRAPFIADVSYPDGSVATGVTVSAREIGFEHRSYSGTTDSTGMLSIAVPQVPLHVTLAPPDDGAAITTIDVDPATEDRDNWSELSLTAGVPVSGVVQLDGDPVPYAVVELRNGETGELLGTTISDDTGAFSVRVRETATW